MNKWKHYEEGKELREGGIVILKILRIGRNQDSTQYRVKYTCCGRVGELSHVTARRRVQRKTKRCQNCRRAGIKNALLIRNPDTSQATWPAPPRSEK